MAYLGVYIQNMTPKITTDQKLDQIQEILVDLVKLAGKTADDVAVLKQDVSEMKENLDKTNTKLDKLTDKVVDHQVKTDSRLHTLETRTGVIHV